MNDREIAILRRKHRNRSIVLNIATAALMLFSVNWSVGWVLFYKGQPTLLLLNLVFLPTILSAMLAAYCADKV
jgi:hypothetical protein